MVATAENVDKPFHYNEQVLLERTASPDVTAVRLEATSQWTATDKYHPFQHLNQLFEVLDEYLLENRLLENDLLEASIKVSSSATQSFPNQNSLLLGAVPLMDNSLPTGPSGFWLCIRMAYTASPHSLLSKVEKLTASWVRQRLINTPVLTGDSGSKWDVLQRQEDGTALYQLFLPANGAAWSADALQQSFRSSLGCSRKDFMGLSATEWSTLLVTGKAWNKQMWWKLSSSPSWQRQVAVGVQFEQSTKDAEILLSSIQSQPRDVACLLGTRSILHVHSSLDTSSPLPTYQLLPTPPEGKIRESLEPLVNVDLVIRRPWPQKGRLETWITAQPLPECKLQFRQVIPPFLTPSWQSLEVVGSEIDEETTIQPSVEWKKDGTSIVTFSSSSVPSSLLLSLEYMPSFLTYDDFPGDPNRGRELAPAVVTVTCPSSVSPYQVYSNSPLILPPVPDMSMPFNVLSLACSLYAYLIGTLVTLLVKRASERVTYKLHPEKKPKSMFEKIKEKIMSMLSRKKVEENTETESVEGAENREEGEESQENQ
eukprot:scaffold8114_cov126-Cylindrotheca_fusiformis.AAC.12